jgi:seryl-tRNA synthetase
VIDLRELRADPERARVSQRARGEDTALVDELLSAEERRRRAVSTADDLRAEQKSLGRLISRASPDERKALLEQAGSLSARVKEAEREQSEAEVQLQAAHLALPNIVEAGAPEGGEENSVVLETVGQIPTYDFTPRDHVEVGWIIGAIDTQRAGKVSGSRFYFLTGPGARLEIALLSYAMSVASRHGFIPMITPALVKPSAMEGTGFLGAHADEVYRLEADDLYLVGTSEVPLAAYHSDEILEESSLPRRYVGFSSCFRREAGSYGKDVRGILRVHQFDKVEMFTFCRPEEAEEEHRRLLSYEREVLDSLRLPYRVVDIAAGDLGSSAARKFDCEVYLPSQQLYREVTSTSNCTDFQARRLNVRFRPAGEKPRPVATLNGTLVAMARIILAILEVHQREDGSVAVPEVLQPYLDGVTEFPALARV